MPIQLKNSFRPDLGQEVIEMLEDFCNSHHESNATEVVRNILVGHIHRKTIVRWIRALDMEPAAIIRSWKASGGPLRFRGGSYNEMAVRSWLIQAVMTEGHTADQAIIIVDEQRP